MSTCWKNQYDFERGDVVVITLEEHPFKGIKGIVNTAYSSKQFGIQVGIGEIVVWSDFVELISPEHKAIPDVFTDAFKEDE